MLPILIDKVDDSGKIRVGQCLVACVMVFVYKHNVKSPKEV